MVLMFMYSDGGSFKNDYQVELIVGGETAN